MRAILALVVVVGATVVPPSIPENAVILAEAYIECTSGDLYKRLLDTNQDGRPDLGTFGRLQIIENKLTYEAHRVVIYYDSTKKGLDGVRDVYLTLPGKAVERIAPRDFIKRYTTPCGLIDE